MGYYAKEPAYHHGQLPRVGILLLNLGTPDAPTAAALRPYLKQFLSDRRVVEIPRAIWWFILNGIILPLRPRKSAEKYAQVWTEEGSPLLVYATRQTEQLRSLLASKVSTPVSVALGMSYGNPSVASAMDKLRAEGCDRILVMPLYPQYAASSTASALDAVWRLLLRTRNVPAIRSLRHYHDHPAYITALADSVREYWSMHGRPDKLVMSFHGVPRRSLDLGDPYHCECHKTGRLLAEALGLEKDQYMVCFQSRFGKAEWLKPYLAATLESLGKQKLGRVDVICPGFSSDCLETLEEIAMEGKATFLQNGGGSFHYIPALNVRTGWMEALIQIVLGELHGWVSADADPAMAHHEAQLSRLRAKALGASD
ncbi:ferrochelatase [Methylobacillus flagellatus]|uniref:ferrochelatase n=1 Tax=Methylobacillus flagellatus TaxID=405 RepID=UPI0010F856CF|nr:ferrochelatase [Methylobacillus flagellatus]